MMHHHNADCTATLSYAGGVRALLSGNAHCARTHNGDGAFLESLAPRSPRASVLIVGKFRALLILLRAASRRSNNSFSVDA
jgi:hypothetical protein